MLTWNDIRGLTQGAALEYNYSVNRWAPCQYHGTHEFIVLLLFPKDSEFRHTWPANTVSRFFPELDKSDCGAYWAGPALLRLATAPQVRQGPDGLFCRGCQDFYPMAQANYGDGLVCYSCRSSHQWKYPELQLKRG